MLLQVVKVVCYIQDMVYMVHLELDKPVSHEFEVRAGGSAGKVDILLQKQEAGVRWSRVGKMLPGHGYHLKAKDVEVRLPSLPVLGCHKTLHGPNSVLSFRNAHQARST